MKIQNVWVQPIDIRDDDLSMMLRVQVPVMETLTQPLRDEYVRLRALEALREQIIRLEEEAEPSYEELT